MVRQIQGDREFNSLQLLLIDKNFKKITQKDISILRKIVNHSFFFMKKIFICDTKIDKNIE